MRSKANWTVAGEGLVRPSLFLTVRHDNARRSVTPKGKRHAHLLQNDKRQRSLQERSAIVLQGLMNNVGERNSAKR